LKGELLPTLAEKEPPCTVVEIAVLPELVHPVRPLSKPPLVTPLAAVTVSVTVVLFVTLGAVPLTVTGYVLGVVENPTLNVSVELPPAVMVEGLNDAVVPAGTPLALSATLSAEPLVTAVEIVDVALPPGSAETLFGLAPIEKLLGAAVTISVTVVSWLTLGAVPLTVTA
jgi:hypothetical protein